MNPIIDKYGHKLWYNEKGECHREDGPAVEFFSGTKQWCINGLLHREDAPAVECYDGSKYWYINGERHREDGPAMELTNGSKYWFYYGKEVICTSQKEFERLIKLRMFW